MAMSPINPAIKPVNIAEQIMKPLLGKQRRERVLMRSFFFPPFHGKCRATHDATQ